MLAVPFSADVLLCLCCFSLLSCMLVVPGLVRLLVEQIPSRIWAPRVWKCMYLSHVSLLSCMLLGLKRACISTLSGATPSWNLGLDNLLKNTFFNASGANPPRIWALRVWKCCVFYLLHASGVFFCLFSIVLWCFSLLSLHASEHPAKQLVFQKSKKQDLFFFFAC